VSAGTLIGGSAGIISLGTFLYRAAPAFWNQYFREMARPIVPSPHKPRLDLWPDKGLHATWLGHSTVVIKVDGLTIVTDPVFSDRVGLGLGPLTLGLKRLVAPAARGSALPVIDLILLSHAHMDHFDRPSLRALENQGTTVITASQTADLLRRHKYKKVHELGWGEQARVGSATVRAFEVNHWGARVRTDTYRGFNGYLIETDRHRIVFGGDTAFTTTFRQVRGSRPADLAIMPIGAYNPWIRYHCNPEQAWSMAEQANVEFVLPVHHQTFQLSREPYREPIERIMDAAGSHPNRVCVHEIGQEFHI